MKSINFVTWTMDQPQGRALNRIQSLRGDSHVKRAGMLAVSFLAKWVNQAECARFISSASGIKSCLEFMVIFLSFFFSFFVCELENGGIDVTRCSCGLMVNNTDFNIIHNMLSKCRQKQERLLKNCSKLTMCLSIALIWGSDFVWG